MDPLLILLFIILFFLSAFFSWTEIALMSLPAHKVDSLVKQKKYWAKSLKKIKSNNDRLLITILIWNNLVNVYTAALATTIAIWLWEKLWLPQATLIWISTWVVTFLLLLFGEILPKSIATKNASNIALFVAPIYKTLMIILFPFITFIEVIIRVFSLKWKVEKMTDEEIESFIDMWRQSWTLEKWEHEKIKNILELDETYVDEIMVPRVKIEALSCDKTIKEAIDFYLSHTHSRIPIYNETIDKIDYFVTWRELLLQAKDWNYDKRLCDIELQKVMKVPLNLSIPTLLWNFQKAHKIMAIVMDEYGGVSWLVTMEDIIEQVFWEIRDETDKEVDEIKRTWVWSFLVEPDVLMEDVLDKLWLELKDIWFDEKEFAWETVSYIITHQLERYPEKWEVISFDIVLHEHEWDKDEEKKAWKLNFIVTDIDDHVIWKIEVKKS